METVAMLAEWFMDLNLQQALGTSYYTTKQPDSGYIESNTIFEFDFGIFKKFSVR